MYYHINDIIFLVRFPQFVGSPSRDVWTTAYWRGHPPTTSPLSARTLTLSSFLSPLRDVTPSYHDIGTSLDNENIDLVITYVSFIDSEMMNTFSRLDGASSLGSRGCSADWTDVNALNRWTILLVEYSGLIDRRHWIFPPFVYAKFTLFWNYNLATHHFDLSFYDGLAITDILVCEKYVRDICEKFIPTTTECYPWGVH